jgi:transcriptional regulator with XRE-family HTH domain
MARRSIAADRPAPLAANLRVALAERGMTQEALARTINVSLSSVNGWCGGESLPRWKSLQAIARVLGRDPSWFYAEHANEPADVAAT